MTENRTALLERTTQNTLPARTDTDIASDVDRQPDEERAQDVAKVAEPIARGPRRWNEGEERLMLYGLLFFFGLGLYAVAFVVFGMWLTPDALRP